MFEPFGSTVSVKLGRFRRNPQKCDARPGVIWNPPDVIPYRRHFASLPALCKGGGIGRSTGVRIRLLGGHVRTIASRQTTAATAPPASTTIVSTQAPIKPVRDDAAERDAGRRSTAAMAGADTAAGSGRASTATSAGAVSATTSSTTSAAIHSPPQRAQRTILPAFTRDAGTSYSAAQLGQAMRMKSRYAKERAIMRRTGLRSKEFWLSKRMESMPRFG